MTRKLTRGKQPEVTISFELITPDMAYDLLANATHNRRLRERDVSRYARDMKDGNWQMTGEPILLNSEGILIGQGQHRLMAVIEADIAIYLPVIRGATRAQRIVADDGIKRTFGDTLNLEYHEPGYATLAAAVRQIWLWRRTQQMGMSGSGGLPSPSRAELIDTYLTEPNLHESVPVARRITSTAMRCSSAVLCGLHYLFNEIDPDEADEFFERFFTGIDLREHDPILAIRKTFSNEDRVIRGAKAQSAVLIKAFNYWREGREVKIVSWRGGGSKPEAYPTINPPEPRENEEAA